MSYLPCLIGEDCEAIHRFRRMGATIPDGPFNQKGIAMFRLIQLLENRFVDIFRKENLTIVEPLSAYPLSNGACRRIVEIVNSRISMESWHDFPYNVEFDSVYEQQTEQIKQAAERLMQRIRYELRPLLFIHKKTDIWTLLDYEDIINQYRQLVGILTELRNGKPFLVTALGKADVFAKKWGIPNLENYKIHTPRLWGSDPIEPIWYELKEMCEPRILLL